MKHFLRTVSIGLCMTVVLVLFAGQAMAEKKFLLKIPLAFSTALPTLGDSIVKFKEYVEAGTEKTVRLKLYDPGKLVPAFEILDATSTGKVDGGYWVSGYATGKIKTSELFTAIPFSQGVPYFMGWLYHGNGEKLHQEMYDQAGYNVKVFSLGILAPETAGWYRKEINSPEDLKGLKIRFFGLGGKVLSKLGASVTTIPGGEIFPALEKGAIDATEFSTPAIDTKLGFYKVAKYNYFPSWHQPVTICELMINKDKWNAMSPRQQAVIEIAVKAVNTYSVAKSYAEQGPVVKENVTVHGTINKVWSPEMLALFRKTFLEVMEEESATDPMFKKVWDDFKAYSASTAPYEKVASIPVKDCID
jgi:TRAP-type mannitol/chloroaromatic compound transport system substrate-binding protein